MKPLTLTNTSIFRISLPAFGLIILAGCGHKQPKPGADRKGGMPPIRVTTVTPHRKSLIRTIELPGRTEAYEFAPLCAKVTGYVQKVPVDIGDLVKGPTEDSPGTVLCELVVPELNEELAEKSALIAQADADVLQSEASVRVAEAAVLSANAAVREAEAMISREEARFNRWQSEYQRVAQLAESGAVTKKVADETRAEFDSANAGRKEVAAKVASVMAAGQEAVARLQKAKADAVASKAHKDVAMAAKRRIERLLDYSILRAPFDGVIVERNVHTGHLVQAGSPKPLLSVMRVDPIRVLTDIPEDDAVHVTKGSKIEIRIPSLPGDPHIGTVTRTAWSLNTTSHTMVAEIDIPNPDGRWRPGLYVQAKVTVAELQDVLSLPRTAVLTQGKQVYCFVVNGEKKIEKRVLVLGLQAGPEVEIRSGVSNEDRVISINAASFREGQAVEIVAAKK